MRKVFIIVAITFLSFVSQAQTAFTHYYVDGTKYSNLITETGDEKGSVYLSLGENDEVMVVLQNSSDRIAFKDFINLTYDKYRNWKRIAVKGKIQHQVAVIKGFDQNGGFCFKNDSKWKYSKKRSPIKALFQVNKGKASYVLVIPKTEAWDNKAMECEPQYIYIQDRRELDNLLTSLSEETIEKHFKAKEAS